MLSPGAFSSDVLWACGLPVESLRLWLVKAGGVSHSYIALFVDGVEKSLNKARVFTQPNRFLYTVFEQAAASFSSVNDRFVHVIHIAYKKGGYLMKGIFI